MIIHVLIIKIVRSGVKCIASLFCYNHLAVCKTHAVVVGNRFPLVQSCTEINIESKKEKKGTLADPY